MSASITPSMPDRLCLQGRVSKRRLARVVFLAGLAWGLAAGVGWWWRVGPAHQATALARESVQALEQELQSMGDQESGGSVPSHVAMKHPPEAIASTTLEESAQTQVTQGMALGRVPMDDDVSALVRWHDLLREHQLHDWQGRSIPSNTMPGAAEADRSGGSMWRLEGPATYEQGVALLQSLARQFPRLMLLLVQVQQLPASEALQWRLELRWSAPGTALAQRWPAGGSLDTTLMVNPFAHDRLRSEVATGLQRPQVDVGDVHVLPMAALQDIRLIGVMGGEDERLAVVAWSSTADQASGVAKPRSVVTSHRVRRGQVLGVEQYRVVSIEPGSVVLQSSRRMKAARQGERREVLALAPQPLEPPMSEGRRP